ncbi:type I polyketide synthase [Nocardia sp. JMUB6875]|uniref:SDR family NAD(P)-dependent oxidoreductase n=1 Tax=Nocardia sp. JMUB6875 TaxID=3158170 RepID=UPI0032E77EF8
MSDAAIVGIGCRFPGGITNPDSLWDFVIHKGDGVVRVPADRWNLEKFYDPDPDAPGRMYTRHGGFLTQSLWEFDADFFGISQREAAIMDPQQRLLLEVTWEALDDAGLAGRVSGRPVGVFMGGFMNDNALVRSGPLARPVINAHSPTSASHTLLSARIAFLLDLLGPTMTIDTACSSSLVALHQAVLALNAGECETAIVGGANVMLRPEAFISMCKGRFLSVDGRCKTFEAGADGYGRGEGAGAVILKPLQAAVRDRDRIYAVVRGSGVNQDGRTLAIPVPNPVAQEALARRVRENAGFEAHEIRYVEAHGTGTAVGDPIEMSALGAVYGTPAGRDEPLPVGSLKNNIGHTEAAAGVAGLIKAALTLHHRTIAPQRRLDNPNPEIRFDELGLRVPLDPEPLPGGNGRIAVAVNSFGYGGTNAHAILEQAPMLSLIEDRADPLPVLPLSARSETALRELAGQLAAGSTAVTEALWSRRAHHPLRTAFTYRDGDDLRTQLAEFAAGGGAAPARTVTAAPIAPVFVFSGMGPQWWGMARGLLEVDGVFADTAREIDEVFEALSGWSIIAEMLCSEEDSRVTATAVAQPANFLVQVALTAELAALGIRPAAVVGHSVGEVAAAYVSGTLSLEDALLVSYHRSRLQATTAGSGGMLAVGLSEDQAVARIGGTAGVSVAAVNSPSAVTLSGDVAELERLRESLDGEGVFARTLRVEVPYHSQLMDPILDELRSELADLSPGETRIPLWSTVTGAEIDGAGCDAGYWCRNVREPVRFADAIEGLVAAGHQVFLEVGPHPVLGGNIREVLARRGTPGAVIGTLARDGEDRHRLLWAVADLYRAGALDTTRPPGAATAAVPHRELPSYPWQRRLLWTEDPATERDRQGATTGYAMLGERTEASASEWEVALSVSNLPWLFDHVVDGSVVLPGAAYVDAALSAVALRTGRTSFGLESVRFIAPIVVDQHEIPVVRIDIEETTHRFTVRSRAATGTTWNVNASGRLIEAEVDPGTADVTPPADGVEIAGEVLYDGLAAHGLSYGPAFRLIERAWVGADTVVAALDPSPLAENASALPHLAHPAIVDAALQCFAALYARSAHESTVVVPASVAGVRWTGRLPDDPLVLVTRSGADELVADIRIAGPDGRVALTLSGVRFSRIAAAPEPIDRLDGLFYEPVWSITEDPNPGTAAAQSIADEFLLVVSLGSTVSQRAKEIAGARPSAEILTIGIEADEEALLAQLRTAHGDAGGRSRVVVVAYSELDAVQHVYGLAVVARAIGRLLGGDEESAPVEGTELRAVVVTENAFCLPVDRFANTAQSALIGARRTLLNEQAAAQWRLIDAEATTPAAAIIEQVLTDPTGPVRADEIALRAGAGWTLTMRRTLRERLAGRDAEVPLSDPDSSFRLEVPRSRLLSELAWRAVDRVAPGPGEIEIRLDAVGLNYKDALKVLGVLTERELAGTYFGTALGMDAYGVVERVGPGITDIVPGDRMSVCARDLLRRYITVRPDEGATMRIEADPETEIDPGQCSSILPFLTAEFAFTELARLQPGETVLIHGAAGGMGMAAVQVAARLGARVIATASTDERRAVAREAGAHEVLESRSISFVDEVLRLTDGRGVDVVYNSSPGEILQQNLRAAAEFGRIVEIGKADIYTDGAIDLRPFDRNLSFFAVDMDRALAARPDFVRRASRRAMDALDEGVYSYLPYTAFDLEHVADAFETVARSKQIGRVVVDLRAEQPVTRAKIPVLHLDPLGSYLVTGGFGAFGLATARWLARAGARRLVLAGRHGATSDLARAAVAELASAGIEVIEERVDVSDYDAVAGLIERTRSSGRALRGVFHAAGVVNNHEVAQITVDSLAEIFGPKAAGAVHLDNALTAAGVEPDLFVLYSSASSVVGISPQMGYAAANSVLDALAAARRARGAPALAVNWGFMSGGGGMADYDAVTRYAEMTGYRPVDMDAATGLLAECLLLDLPQVLLMDVDWARWSTAYRASTRTARFAEQVATAGGGASGAAGLRAEVLALGADQRGEVVAYLLAEQLAAVLGVDAETVDLDTPLPDLGLDSLMGMEFGARVVQVLGVQMSVLAVIGLTLRGLGGRIGEQIAQEEERAARINDSEVE